MKLIALCCLLLLGLLGFLAAPGAASPSRHTGPAGPSVPGSGNPFRAPSPQQRPLYYDAPVGKPSKTMYA
ncbi:immune-induced peptide 18 [Drosophila mauritiana]|uniref:Immune-induced peptide 18 n=1 Tax=Drosophila mauritiana TaxID=7226 RepID=A0A6P8JDG5_DROMA|nr:immune-induced peptide 18 [Drosophila mauritiana]